MEQKNTVQGIIYKIKHKHSGKVYVGQTRSHILNHGKYRPAGAEKRWKKHISAAKCQSAICGIPEFYETIATEGEEAFECSVLETCQISEVNDRESFHIIAEHALEPVGYNISQLIDAYGKARVPRDRSKKDSQRITPEALNEPVQKALLMVIDGVAPKVTVFLQTPTKQTNRTMLRSTFTSEFDMQEAKQRAEAFARQFTPHIEYTTGRSKLDQTLQKWKELTGLRRLLLKPLGTQSAWKLQAETDTLRTARNMPFCQFFYSKSGEAAARAKVTEFVTTLGVPLVDTTNTTHAEKHNTNTYSSPSVNQKKRKLETEAEAKS